MHTSIAAIIFSVASLGYAKDYPSPQGIFSLRVDAAGARLISTAHEKVIHTVASAEQVSESDGWLFGEVRWHQDGLCFVVIAGVGNRHRFQRLEAFRISDYEESATVQKLNLETPFSKLLPKDKDRDPEATFRVFDAYFPYGGALTVTYRQEGTGSSQWTHEPDADYYLCEYSVREHQPFAPISFRRVRTTSISME